MHIRCSRVCNQGLQHSRHSSLQSHSWGRQLWGMRVQAGDAASADEMVNELLTSIQYGDVIHPSMGSPPEVECIPTLLPVHASIWCPRELNCELLNATLSPCEWDPAVDLWVPACADVESQRPVKANVVRTNLQQHKRWSSALSKLAKYLWCMEHLQHCTALCAEQPA